MKWCVHFAGQYKGYIGIVKDATETLARVELNSNCQTINVDKSRLALVTCVVYDCLNYIPRRKSGIYWIQVRRAAAAAVEISLWTR